MSEEKKSLTITITHKIELLIWLIILCILVGIFSATFMYKEKNGINDYKIFINDVDGLIVGSPVRMMGIEVGHVVKIKPTKENMYVKFIITHPDVIIPQGTKITVESNGLGGSKSLELYPPDKTTYIDNETPIITVIQPTRLNEAIGLLGHIYDKLNSIILNCTYFGKKIEEIDFNGANIQNQTDFITESNRLINKFSHDK